MKKDDDSEYTTYDRIRKYYLEDNITLSPKTEAIRKRWMSAHTLLLDSDLKEGGVVKTLMKMYDITERQAYRDIRDSSVLFGHVLKIEKAAWRHMITQWSIEMLRKAEKKNDFMAVDAALCRIISVNNLDKEDSLIPDLSLIQPPTQLLTIDFDFYKSPYFKLIDKKAQRRITMLYNKLQSMAEEFMVADYKDILLTREEMDEEKALRKIKEIEER